jgi:hypothetical protein
LTFSGAKLSYDHQHEGHRKMSASNAGAQPTVEQMWAAFLHEATRGDVTFQIPDEVRPAFYAGCHRMLEAVMATLRTGNPTPASLNVVWQGWMNELGKYSEDYNAARNNLAAPAVKDDHFPELLAALDPETALEARERLAHGDIAYLPSQLRFKKGRTWFPGDMGWVPTDLNPEIVPVHDISVIFLVKIPAGYTLEARFKSGWKPGMPWPPKN